MLTYILIASFLVMVLISFRLAALSSEKFQDRFDRGSFMYDVFGDGDPDVWPLFIVFAMIYSALFVFTVPISAGVFFLTKFFKRFV